MTDHSLKTDYPRLSVVLPTVFRKDLIKSTLASILPQLDAEDELVISLNVPDDSAGSCRETIEKFIASVKPVRLRIVSPPRRMKVFEHWNFAIANAMNECVVFIHDDEIYHQRLLQIGRDEFSSDSEISLIIGGQINVIAKPDGIHSYKETWFDEHRKYDRLEWIHSQSDETYPKFGATAYLFKREPDGFWFFERNTRVSDALLMYHLSLRGKVIERKEFFGTHLEHAANTMLTEMLELNHSPYWQGLGTMAERENVGYLSKASSLLKASAHQGYSRCAMVVALALRNRAGYAECLRQCDISGSKPSLLLRVVDKVPFKWTLLPPLIRLAKKLRRKAAAKKISPGSEHEALLAELLEISPSLVSEFKNRATSHAR